MDGLRLNGEKRIKNLFSSFTIHIAIESPCRVALSGPKMQKNELKCHKVDFLELKKNPKKSGNSKHTKLHLISSFKCLKKIWILISIPKGLLSYVYKNIFSPKNQSGPRLSFSRLLRVVNTCTTRGPREEYAWNTRGIRVVHGRNTRGIRVVHGRNTRGIRVVHGRNTRGIRVLNKPL
jgi:hypothetical protein